MFNYKKMLPVIMLLALLFSLTVVTASDTTNTTKVISNTGTSSTGADVDDVSDNVAKKVSKRNASAPSTKTDSNNKIIYVANNGDSSINTTSMSNPTTIENAFKILEDDATIYLEDNGEETVYDINSYISTYNNTNVKNFRITTSEDNKVVLRFSSNEYFLNCYHNISLSNVALTNKGSSKFPLVYNAGLMNITNCSFYYNNTDSTSSIFHNVGTATLNNCKFYSVKSTANENFIRNENTLTLNNCNIHDINNTSKYGLIYNRNNLNSENTLTLNNCSIHDINNTSKYGLIYNRNNLNLNNCHIYNNTGYLYACAIYSINGKVNIRNSVIENQYSEYGSVITLHNSSANYYNTTFKSNKASFGGVFLLNDSELNVSECVFVNNSAKYNGGVINSWYSRAFFNSSRFINNSATYGGVSYDVNNHYMKFSDSLFENNTAGAIGDNIYSVNDNLTVRNSIILDSNNKTSIYCYDVSYDFDENWWGLNNPRFDVLTNGIIPSNWRLMKVTATKNANKYRLNVSLNNLSDSTSTTKQLINRNITFESSTGSYAFNSSLINSSITNEYEGNLDDALIMIDHEVLSPSNKTKPYLFVDDISTKINDNTSIIIKCNPDITGNVKIQVNNSLLTTVLPVKGSAEYKYAFNSTWKVGTYNLSVSLSDDAKYADTTMTSTLNIKENYNTTVTLIDAINKKVIEEEEEITIPDSYDSRNYGYVSSVKDQGRSGSCWAFGPLATLESSLLKIYGETYDFSENYMKNTLKKFSVYGNRNSEPDDGGNDLIVVSFLSGWYGPVTEEEDAYNDHSIMSPTLNNTFHIQDIYFIPPRKSYTDNDALKLAIMKYGSVSADFYALSNNDKNTSYTQIKDVNHAISVVGWDDNYPKENFTLTKESYTLTPPGNGAWIIKNSWGTSIGIDGYQYVSYYDESFGGLWQDTDSIYLHNLAFPLNESETYSSIYQHDTVTDIVDFLTPSAWVRNVYTAQKNESIAAVGTIIYEDCDYEVYVYVNDKLCYSQNGTILQEGFRTIKLDKYIPVVEGDVFRVDFKLKAHVGDYTLVTLQDTNEYMSFSKANQSFISTDGENWIDLYTDYELSYADYKINKTAACLKVYTKETPSIYSTINQTNCYNITTQIKNLNTSTGRLSYKINGEYCRDNEGNIIYVEVLSDGSYNIEIPLESIEEYEYNVSVIFENDDYIITENITIVTATRNVTMTPEKLMFYVDDEQVLPVKVKIENNTYNIVLDSGVVLLYDENGRVIDKSNVYRENTNFTLNLNAGKYNFTLYYRGSYAYNSEYTNIILDIIKHTVKVYVTDITKTTVDDTTLIKGYAVYDDNKALKNTKLGIVINGRQFYVTTDNNGKFNLSYKIDTVGTIGISTTFNENTTHYGATNYTEFTSKKHKSTISIANMNTIAVGEVLQISGKITDENDNPLTNMAVDIYIDNNKITSVTSNKNGEYTTTYTTTKVGTNTIKIVLPTNTKYEGSTAQKTVNIRKQNTKITLTTNAQTVKVGSTIQINGTLTSELNENIANAKIIIHINNNNITTTTTNSGIFNYYYQTTKNETINIWTEYKGNNNYQPTTSTTKTVKSQKIGTKISFTTANTTIGNITINGKITDENNAPLSTKLTVKSNNVLIATVTSNKGIFTFKPNINSEGTYRISVDYATNATHSESSAAQTVRVTKREANLNAVLRGNDVEGTNITISLNDAASKAALRNANVIITFTNGTKITQTTNSNGQILSNVKLASGSNKLTFTYTGNGTYYSTTKSVTITIKKLSTSVTASLANSTVGNVIVTGTVADEKKSPVKEGCIIIKANNKVIGKNIVANGKFTVKTNITNAGKLDISITYYGSSNYYGSSKTLTNIEIIKLKSAFTNVQQVNNVYGKTSITAVLKDQNNKVIANAVIKLSDKSGKVIATANTNSKGKVSLKAKCNSGNNNLTLSYAGNTNVYGTTSNKIVRIYKDNVTVTLSPVTGVIGENITLTAKLYDTSKNPVNGGNLVFKLNGKTLRVDGRFDSTKSVWKFAVKNGIVKISIKADLYLRNAKYLAASYSGSSNYNKGKSSTVSAQIKKRNAKLKLTITPNLAKQYKSVTFRIKVSDVTKNHKNNTLIYTNTRVAFKINGVTLKSANGSVIYAKVNKNGVATYKYIIPAGMSGLNGKLQLINRVTALFIGENYYSNVKDSKTFNVERSSTKIVIKNVTVTKKNKLSVNAVLKDYKNNNLIGANKILLKINGKSYINPDTKKTEYFTAKNGVISLKNIKVSRDITIKRVMIVCEQSQAYLGQKNETSKIIRV